MTSNKHQRNRDKIRTDDPASANVEETLQAIPEHEGIPELAAAMMATWHRYLRQALASSLMPWSPEVIDFLTGPTAIAASITEPRPVWTAADEEVIIRAINRVGPATVRALELLFDEMLRPLQAGPESPD